MNTERKRFGLNPKIWQLQSEIVKQKTTEINRKMQKLIEESSIQFLSRDHLNDYENTESLSNDSPDK